MKEKGSEEKSSFIVYNNYHEKFKDLSRQQLGDLWWSVFEYENTGAVPEIPDIAVKMCFNVVKVDLDDNRKRYLKGIEDAKRAAQIRWDKERAKDTTACDRMQNIQPNANDANMLCDDMTCSDMSSLHTHDTTAGINHQPAREDIPPGADDVDKQPTLAEMQAELDNFQEEIYYGRYDRSDTARATRLDRYEMILLYAREFHDPKNAAVVAGRLVDDFGYDLVKECIEEVAARASPPGDPPTYIRKMCENRSGGSG
jgi:hypothetical protein